MAYNPNVFVDGVMNGFSLHIEPPSYNYKYFPHSNLFNTLYMVCFMHVLSIYEIKRICCFAKFLIISYGSFHDLKPSRNVQIYLFSQAVTRNFMRYFGNSSKTRFVL